MAQNPTSIMSLKKLLLSLLLAIFDGLSLHYISASNTTHELTRSPPKVSRSYTVRYFEYNASATEAIVGEIEKLHARHFVDSRFTTEELANSPEAKAVIEFLQEPLQAVVTFDSDVELKCKYLISFLESCAVWLIAANTDPATARPLLHTINTRAHRCAETLEKVIQQHNLLEQLTQRLTDTDGVKENAVDTLSLLIESEREGPAQDLFLRVMSLSHPTFGLSRRLVEWNVKIPAAVESLSVIREFLAGQSEKLATVAARDDVGFAQDLPVLLRNCRKEYSFYWR